MLIFNVCAGVAVELKIALTQTTYAQFDIRFYRNCGKNFAKKCLKGKKNG